MRPACKVAILALVAMLGAGCSASTVPTTEPLLSTTSAPTANPPAPTTTQESTDTTVAAEPLEAGGCELFDPAELGALSPPNRPLTLIESSSTAEALLCNYIVTGDGISTAVRIEVQRTADLAANHFTSPGEFETAVEIAGRRGVAFGRGNIRLQVDEDRGVTLAVMIQAISSTGEIPRDGDYIAIRNRVAEYLVPKLG